MARPGRKATTRRTAKAVPASAFACPPHVTGEAAVAWGHVVGMLDSRGLLDRTDPVIVECYATNVATLRQANAAIAALGVVVKNGHGAPGPNPACAIANAASMRLRGLANDLGLTPSSSKHATDATPSDGGGKWDGMLEVVG